MILEIKDLVMRFGGLIAINKLSFSVEQGEIYSIIGPNGAGKTTVLNCLNRFYTPQEGSIMFEGRDLLKLRCDQVIRCGIARSFQNVELFAGLSLRDNLQTGNDYTLKTGFLTNVFALPKYRKERQAAQKRVDEVVELMGLGRYVNERVKDLPFGIQKRVDMGRALISNPKLLLLDEPAAGTNTQETEELSDIIRNLCRNYGLTALMIEHDMSFVMKLSDRVMCMDFGKKIAEGSPAEIQTNPLVIEAYLGEKDDFFC